MFSFNRKSKRSDVVKAMKNIAIRRERYYKCMWKDKKISKVHIAMIRGDAVDNTDIYQEDNEC